MPHFLCSVPAVVLVLGPTVYSPGGFICLYLFPRSLCDLCERKRYCSSSLLRDNSHFCSTTGGIRSQKGLRVSTSAAELHGRYDRSESPPPRDSPLFSLKLVCVCSRIAEAHV